jgi:hypothetical protein
MPISPENGVVNLASSGMTIFALIDQQGAARAAGVTMQPVTLAVFGDPKAGTPLMQAHRHSMPEAPFAGVPSLLAGLKASHPSA